MIGTVILLGFLLAALAVLVASVVIFICTSAIVFSRITLSLMVALVMTQNGMELVPGGGFLNYVACVIIVLAVVYFISTLFPRVDVALNFLSTVLISTVVVYIVTVICGTLISAIAGKTFAFTTGYEILIKAISTGAAVFGLITLSNRASYDSPKTKIAQVLERLVASLIYGAALIFLFVSLNHNWELNGIIGIALFLVFTVVAYIADIRLFGKDVLGLNEEEHTMPR